MDPSTPPVLHVSSSATLINGYSFVGGPVSITMSITGTTVISSPQALITPVGGESVTMPMSEKSSGAFVAVYDAPANLGNSGVDRQYTVIVSAIAAGTAVSSMCKFTVPSAGGPPPLPP